MMLKREVANRGKKEVGHQYQLRGDAATREASVAFSSFGASKFTIGVLARASFRMGRVRRQDPLELRSQRRGNRCFADFVSVRVELHVNDRIRAQRQQRPLGGVAIEDPKTIPEAARA